MTTPHQPAPDGAFVIGGDDFGFGQGLNDAGAAQLMLGSVAGLSNPLAVFNTIGSTLASLPLEVLNLFAPIIPGIEIFKTVSEAVSHITEFFGQIGPMLFSTFSDWLTNSFNWLSREVQQIFDIVSGIVVVPVTAAVGLFKDWFGGLTGALQGTANTIGGFLGGLWGALTGQAPGTNKSIADVSNAASNVAGQANTGLELGEWNNAVLGIRNNKSIMQGIDETEESTFLLSDLFNGATDPPSITATASVVPIGFWRATETAKKGFFSWFGKGFASISALYVDIYRLNYTTNKMVLVHTSPNQIGQVTTSWRYLIYNIANETDRILVNAGDVLGVALRVVGSGTHTIGGKSAPWMPDHPTVVPSRPSATRTGSGDLDFSAITYSGDIPWFGIGIINGDVPPPYFAPRYTEISTAGAFSYQVEPWMNFVDCVYLSGGGGGQGGNGGNAATGEGGEGGVWVTETLVRGVDFPQDFTGSLTGVVGAGGAAGAKEQQGQDGGDTYRSVISSGKAEIRVTGGNGGDSSYFGGAYSGPDGKSPGNITFQDKQYIGGQGVAWAPDGANGGQGNSPGGGGGAGKGGFYGLAWPGGNGARGGAWFTARQT